MPTNVQITLRDLPSSEALETHIRDKFDKLFSMYPQVISTHIVIELPHRHHQQGKDFNVRVDLDVPGGEIIVNQSHYQDPYVAFHHAFDSMRYKLEDFFSRRSQAEQSNKIIWNH